MTSIDKTNWEAVSALLDELLEADAAQRAIRLAHLQTQDPALGERVASLLAQQAAIETEQFLEGSAFDPLGLGTLVGHSIGGYTLDRSLGQGGMGSVWLARRSDGRYEGQAAIKFLNLALLGRGGAERLRREANVLAKLAHPNITHLIDAGVAIGQPYLVLEYVEGEPIDRWCDARELDVAARVRLFLQVLAAVAHAHGRLILHRDLKPSNILVTKDGRAKLLDFGIAKLLEGEGQTGAPTALTRLGSSAMTPEYAAPEQIQHSEVTTATDVYSLGVLLHVLLSGSHPTARATDTPVERLRALVEREPVRLSEAALQGDPAVAQARGASPMHLARTLRGDLDNIVAKALKKSPAERYSTVDAFADDLQRHLNHQPVNARADSRTYRMTRFIARHALGLLAITTVLMTIIAAAAISLWQAREATRQRDRALSMSARNEAVVDFVSTMLTEVAPTDQPVRIADLLDRSQSILMTERTNPEHRAAILGLLSNYYLGLGKATEGEALLVRALDMTRDSTDGALRAVLLCDNAYAASLLGRPADAEKAMQEGLTLSKGDALADMRCLRDRAFIAQNSQDSKAALDFALQAQARLKESPVAKPDIEAALLADIAYAHYLSGHTGDADRYYAASMAKLAELGRDESPGALSIRNNWGIASFAAGDNLRALQHYDEALRLAARSIDGVAPPYLLLNRAGALSSLGRYSEALPAFDTAIEAAVKSGNVPARINNMANRANTYALMGEVDRAEREVAGLAGEIGKTVPPDSVPAVTIQQAQARVAFARERWPEAIAKSSAIIAFFDSRGMAIAPVTRMLTLRADAYVQQGNLDAAMADAQRALKISRGLQGDIKHSSLTGMALSLMARVQASRHEDSQARDTAREAVAHLIETLGPDHAETRRAQAIAM